MIQDNFFPLFPHQHLLAIKDLSVQDLNTLLDRAEANVILSNKIDKTKSTLHGRTQINLFLKLLREHNLLLN